MIQNKGRLFNITSVWKAREGRVYGIGRNGRSRDNSGKGEEWCNRCPMIVKSSIDLDFDWTIFDCDGPLSLTPCIFFFFIFNGYVHSLSISLHLSLPLSHSLSHLLLLSAAVTPTPSGMGHGQLMHDNLDTSESNLIWSLSLTVSIWLWLWNSV